MRMNIFFLVVSVLCFACSKKDVSTNSLKPFLNDTSVTYNGRWTSGCVDNAFFGGKQAIELNFTDNSLSYIETFYSDEFCQNISSKNEFNGSWQVVRKNSDDSVVVKFSIPIDENISAIRYFNLKNVDPTILISQFHSDAADSNTDLVYQLNLDAK